ncbi:MAG: hypothetical protein ACI4IF_08580 [Acutalibacteraceae bacterium]
MVILCFLILAVFAAVSFLIYKKSDKAKDGSSAFLCALVGIVVFCTGLEISVFNINYYITKSYEPIDISEYFSAYEAENGTYVFKDNENIEVTDLNKEIKNIRIKLTPYNDEKITLNLYLTDEANAQYFANPEITLYSGVDKSQYINIHTAGITQNILLKFESESLTLTNVESVTINCNRPFEFSLIRLLCCIGISALIYLFRPSSVLYKRKLKENLYTRKLLITSVIIAEIAIIVTLSLLNPVFLGFSIEDGKIEFQSLKMSAHNQYDELAQAVLNGKVYIDNDDIPETLKNMENPYDTTNRALISKLSGDTYRWDVAYYNGHYYVYFGIVPLLLMYLPFRAIVGQPFPTVLGIILFAVLFAIGVIRLLDFIARKKFENISIGTFLLTAITFINCCGMIFLAKRPDFYGIPIITAITFIIWGIYLWLRGLESQKHKKLLFFFGALFMALSVGCRPQAVLMCFVALPIFWHHFFSEKHILKKEGIKELITLAVPFIIVALGLMYYNYIRFGSPIDFGSSYNLTTNDVTKRGFDFGRIGLGLFTYLFQTPSFTATFPFIKAVTVDTNYIGKTVYEYCFGGLLVSLPVLWYILGLKKSKNTLKANNLYTFTCTLLLIGVVTVIVNTEMGGLLQRYFCDFGYIFFLATSFIIFALYDKKSDKNCVNLPNSLLTVLCFVSIFYSITLAFSVADVTIDSSNPTVFGELQHLVEFWK